MTTEATPGALGSNAQLGLDPERALWEAMGCIADDEECLRMLSAHIAAAVAAERERLKTLAHNRAGYEAASAAHHAGKWHAAFENHMTRNAAMCDLIDALFGPNDRANLTKGAADEA